MNIILVNLSKYHENQDKGIIPMHDWIMDKYRLLNQTGTDMWNEKYSLGDYWASKRDSVGQCRIK